MKHFGEPSRGRNTARGWGLEPADGAPGRTVFFLKRAKILFVGDRGGRKRLGYKGGKKTPLRSPSSETKK